MKLEHPEPVCHCPCLHCAPFFQKAGVEKVLAARKIYWICSRQRRLRTLRRAYGTVAAVANVGLYVLWYHHYGELVVLASSRSTRSLFEDEPNVAGCTDQTRKEDSFYRCLLLWWCTNHTVVANQCPEDLLPGNPSVPWQRCGLFVSARRQLKTLIRAIERIPSTDHLE